MSTDNNKIQEMVRFWRQFSIMLSSGVPIIGCLEVQQTETALPELRNAINKMIASIRNGKTISNACAQFSDLFSSGVVALCEAGEMGGVLDKVAERIANGLEKGALAVSGEGGEVATVKVGDAENNIIKFVDKIIADAIHAKASDIHIEPTEDGGQIRYRVDGVLQKPEKLDQEKYNAVLSRIMIMANLDIAEKRRPQDGRCLLNLEGRELDLRISGACFRTGYSLTMRILDKTKVNLDIDKCGFLEEALTELTSWTKRPNGMYIISGPTGSGKTTILYSLLKLLATPERKVLSAENPVEYLIDGILQAEVRASLGVTFSSLIRSFLRQAPNVISVGEIRDLETAQICAQAAMTGHLVITQLHTENATGVPRRLTDIGMEPWLVALNLKGSASMRLVRAVCPDCAETYEPNDLDIVLDFPDKKELKKGTYKYGKGCEKCNHYGYRGRIPVIEFLPITENIKDLIAKNESAEVVRKAAIKEGMVTMRHYGMRLAAKGVTTIEEVLRVTAILE